MMTTAEPRIVENYPHVVKEIEHIWIPMSDGVRLSARVWMPEDADKRPVPAILEYIPYRKRDGTRTRDDCRHRYWAGHGYACIRLDIRGTGESEGLITDEYPKSEQDDCVEAIAWIAEQAWCSGAVGMTGISWGGFNGLQVAARRPPALKAIITHCSTDDRYADDVHWMGGCLLTDGFFWASGFYHFMSKPADPAIVGEGWREDWLERMEKWEPPGSHIWLKHQRRDDYWRHGSVCENYDDIECAVFAVGGWEDGYSNAVPRLLANLSCPKKGLIGPWGHKYPEVGIPGPAIGFLQYSLRWWDHWLKGHDTGIMDDPQYTVYQQDYVAPGACLDYVPGKWISEPSWPSPNVTEKVISLSPGRLTDRTGSNEMVTLASAQTLGATGGSWCPYGLGGSSPDLAIDQREDDGRSIVFESDPIGEEFALLGAPIADFTIKTDQSRGFVCVRLMDVAPDGTSRRISFGLLNLTHRDDHEVIADMPVDEWVKIKVQLNDVSHRVQPGHRLRLAVSTTYWPMVWPSPKPVTLSISTGESSLMLPVRQSANGDQTPDLGQPEMAPRGEADVLIPASSGRKIERDLATGIWTETLLEDGGRSYVPAIDLDVADGMTCSYTIQDDDPLSAEAVWNWHSTRNRDGWDIAISTETRLRATETEWLCDTEIDAKQDGVSVFSRAWRERIPRDGV